MIASRRSHTRTQKQDTCTPKKKKIMASTLTRHMNKPQPQNSVCKTSKVNYPNIPTPPKQTIHAQMPQKLKHPKGITNS